MPRNYACIAISLFLVLSSNGLFCQDIWEDPEQLLTALQESSPLDYDDIRAYLQVSYEGPDATDVPRSFLVKADSIAQRANNIVGQAHVKNAWALYHNIYYQTDADFEASISYERQAVDLYEAGGEPLMAARAQIDLGTDLCSIGRYAEAEAPMVAAIPVLEAEAEPLVLSEGYSRMAFLYDGLDEPNEVRRYAQKAFDLVTWEESPYLYLSAADQLVRALVILEEFDAMEEVAATIYAKRALLDNPDDADTYVRIQTERALAKIMNDEPEAALTILNEAFAVHREATGFDDDRLRRFAVPKAYAHHQLLNERQAVEALDDYFGYVRDYEALRISPLAGQVAMELAPYLEARGETDKALAYVRRAYTNQRLADSTEIASLRAERAITFETARKEARILDQDAQLARQRLILTATVAGLLVVLAFGLTLFFLARKLSRRNGEYRKLLTHKEALVKEVHHRVKNNLQMLSSLFRLQESAVTGDTEGEQGARNALKEGSNRINAMGLLHQQLYADDEVTSVDTAVYFEELGKAILSASTAGDQIDLYQDIESVWLDVDLAIPLGLIYNELVTNAVKYAFPGGRSGTIEVNLQVEANDTLIMRVADDGVGLREESTGTRFGSRLISLLAAKMNAELEEVKEVGYGVQVSIPEFSAATIP
ncbi:sensor histidine kinase [Lewinella sp. 4G2]|uniref:sensor histidine kinase n=1 Tax=Lewinella sp. 4G2 TaxID=1803372 RepID=UPI0007B4B443|nr:sensor histidine kinase [Lewinella sp. 4G2]OAV42942.1 hypothetical protein A3850_017115 [Lewinella sp. 4G2]